MSPGRKVKEVTIERILERTERDGDCMIWKGATHSQGYGMMRVNGEMRTVHSVVAELKYGRKPTKTSGDRVTRTCDNAACVNPDHIVILDASFILKGKTVVKGKFSEEQIREIRRRYNEDRYHGIVRDLAREYNAKESLISAICRNRLYKRVK